MPSPRRMRLLMLAAVVTVIFVLFYRSGVDSGGEHDGQKLKDFYHKTHAALERSPAGQAVVDTQTGKRAGSIPADKDADGDVDADDVKAAAEMQANLKASAQKAKDDANKKGGLKPDPPREVVGIGSSREGQEKKELTGEAAADDTKKKEPVKETPEEHTAEMELNRFLKQSPVVIFSKSYCPHSKRAKGLLLEKYTITPKPFVVELDQHDLGQEIQDLLLAKTDRRTVPNILINGVSIGGASDIVELDEADKLVSKIVDLGQKRVEITKRFVSGGSNHV